MVLDVAFSRVWANPSPHTFTIDPIRQLLIEEVHDRARWLDPFAGFHSIVPPDRQNDLNPDTPALHHGDALDWLRTLSTENYDGVLYDPPYSMRQATEVYHAYGRDRFEPRTADGQFSTPGDRPGVTNMAYWARCKDEAARVVKPGGKAICFGWNTGGLGNQRLFQLDRVLLVPHGGSRNDTLVTVEHKKGGRLL